MNFLKITFLVLMFLQFAHAAMAQVARIDKQGNVIVKYISGDEVKAGTIEVIPKGTLLYHWGNATPEQAKAWNDAGKISPDLLAKLRLGSGFAGGGFYVSKNYFDSIGFGNTLVVIELQKDIKIVHTDLYFKWSNPTLAAAEKIGVSAAGVPHTRNWMNIIDADALIKEFVADAKFFANHLPEKIEPSEYLEALTQKIPGLNEETAFQEIALETRKLEKGLLSKNNKTASNAFLKILESGSQGAKQNAFNKLDAAKNPAVYSRQTIDLLVKMTSDENSIMKMAATRYLYLAGQKNSPINSYLFSRIVDVPAVLYGVAKNIQEQLPADQASTLFQEAVSKLGDQTPSTVQDIIAEMKQQGTWNPQIMCSKAFE